MSYEIIGNFYRLNIMLFTNKILFFLTASIILIHTVIPHYHHSEGSEFVLAEKNNSSNDLLAIIKLAFHQSPSSVLKNAELLNPGFNDSSINNERSSFFNTEFKNYQFNKKKTTSEACHNLIVKRNIICQYFKGLRSPPMC